MSFAVGTRGIDSARPVNNAIAFNTGSRFAIRYSAGAATAPNHPAYSLNAPKLCGQGEIATILNSSQDFLADDEWYEARTYEGTQAGQQDAAPVLDFWQSRGLAKGSTIMLNLDTYPNMGRVADVQNYIDGYNSALNGYYVADGFYAGVPMLAALAKSGHCKHGWIPEAASWSSPNNPLDPSYAPPARSDWDLWFPTPSQVAPAGTFLMALLGDCGLTSCIWQDGNKWFSGLADEDVVILAGLLGTHNEALAALVASGAVVPVATPVPGPAPVPAPAPVRSPYHGQPWPGGQLHFGPNDHFGNVNGPATSHGGYYPAERPFVQMIQRQLIYGGYIPGVTDPYSGWADGTFDIRGGGPGGPTTDAVTRFQHDRRANSTTLWGQVWSDDWATLFAL